MSEQGVVNGSCLCDAVKLSTTSANKKVGACHCGMCRKWGGSSLLVIECNSDLNFSSRENIGIYQSSDWAERGFCNKCGTHLFYRFKQNDLYYIPVGIFDNLEGLVFDHQIFIDKKPEFYSFANETKNLTEEETFAMFGSVADKL